MRYDLIAGLSIAGLLLPESIAYASIAGLAPQHALFAAIIGMMVYAAAGRSRFAIVAPTSSSAAILGGAIATVVAEAAPGQREALAAGAVGLAGLFFIITGVARLGRLSSFISRPVLRGFAFGLGVTIVARQAPILLALHGVAGNPFQIGYVLVEHWRDWNMTSLAIGGLALAALVGLRRFPRLPGAFVVLAAGIALSLETDLVARGVKLVGAIDIIPFTPGLPDLSWREWTRLGEVAAPLFLILYAESWGSMRNMALRHGETLDANRELLALGAANIASGLIRGMPVGAGFSATAANEVAGARSRIAGLVAAAAMSVMLAVGGAYIAKLPEPVLAAVVIAALLHALDPAPLVRLWRIDRDQYIALAAALGVMIFGVVDGVLLAVALSIAATLERMATPKIVVLGRLRHTHDFVEADHPEAVVDPRIDVLRPSQPLFFANAESVFADVAQRVESNPAVRAVIISLEETTSLDSTALDGLIECHARMRRDGRRLYLARVKQSIIDTLLAAGETHLASSEVRHWSVAGAWDEAMEMLGRVEAE